tara:strand:- start:469 stop:828 length:360 start_codon:yes stop_codon:yes gene_type:complete
MTTIIEIQERGLSVMMQGQKTLISKHEDENGDWYFLNENLKKQYIKDTPMYVALIEKQKIEKSEDDNELKEYRFEVEYEHKGRLRGWAYTETKVEAKSYDEALEKVKSNFKNIYEISEL